MKLKALAAIAALMMVTGCGATATTPKVQEDDASWTCLEDGNKICGSNAVEQSAAWGSFNIDSVPADIVAGGFKVDYVGVALEGVEFPTSEYVTVESELSPGKVNVWMLEAGK